MQEEDPAVFILLREGAIHIALGLPNPPCNQGLDVTQSGANFRAWLNTTICNQTPLSQVQNGVYRMHINNSLVFFEDVYVQLKPGQVDNLERALGGLFNQRQPPPGSTAEWSEACKARGLLLGHVFIVGAQGSI